MFCSTGCGILDSIVATLDFNGLGYSGRRSFQLVDKYGRNVFAKTYHERDNFHIYIRLT